MSNDRFKFRAYLPTKAKMYHNVGVSNVPGEFFALGNPSRCLRNGIIMQSTGLLDQNGKMIFEGDILLRDSRNCAIVEWFEDCAGWLPWCDPDEYQNPANMQVIGNLYENPELLAKNGGTIIPPLSPTLRRLLAPLNAFNNAGITIKEPIK